MGAPFRISGRVVAFVAAIAVAALVVLSGLSPPSVTRAPAPVRGTVDLTGWDFARNGSASLSGEWQYFDQTWARDVSPAADGEAAIMPGPWPAHEVARDIPRMHGFGTYVLHVRLPETQEGQSFGIDTGYVLSAYRVYANGRMIVASGVPGATAGTETANVYSHVAAIPSGVRDVELKFEVSNHVNRFGGTFVAPVLGDHATLVAHVDFIRAISMLLVGAMIFAALFQFVSYALNRDAAVHLWFGAFAALLAVRTLTIEPLAIFSVPLIGQDWIWRIDFATSILLLPASFQFFMLSFPRQISSRLAPWINGFCLGAAGFSLVGGPVIGEFAMKVYEGLALFAIVYLTYGLLRAVLERELGGVLAFAGWVLSAAASLHDILIDNGVITGINLIPFGFFAFFLCLSGMLASRFRDAFRRAENASRRMKSLNAQLETAVEARTIELSEKIEELNRNQGALELARTEAVSANIAKSRFLATMSHELRTPLNAILGFSEIIRDARMGSIGDPRYSEYAGHIHEGGAHLLSLIGDILDLSRIEAGKAELHPEELAVRDVCEASIRLAASRAKLADDFVQLQCDRGLPLLNADRRALMQMIMNLLSNALKFSPSGGSICLSAFVRADGGVTVQVADAGIGMDAQDIPKALAVFTQVDDALSRRHEGSGLGLPIVKSLCELHDGKLLIESKRHSGTTVRLEFPASRSVACARARLAQA